MCIKDIDTNMKEDIVIQKFIDNWFDFDLSVRERNGINKEKLMKLESSFKEIKELISALRMVPIPIAGIFIDLYSAIESQSSCYKNEQEILKTADYLAGLARDVCYP